MQQWEYCEIEVTVGGPLTGVHAEAWIYKEDGTHLHYEPQRKGVLMAKLGKEGWEVITSSARIEAGLNKSHKLNYILKRPLVEDTQ